MDYKSKALAMAGAILVLAAVSASSASANFHAEVSHTVWSSTATGSMSTDPGTVHCQTIHKSGTSASTTTESMSTSNEEGTECIFSTIFGNISVSVNTNGCTQTTTTGGEIHINCPAGKSITISGPGCTVTIPAQTLSGNTYTNLGSGSSREILVHTSATGMAYSYTGFTCGSGSGTKNGTYSATSLIRASDTSGKQVGIWHQI